ncbi:XrtA/PEP-CTERM system exopolysaccharide export protein [Immundisolibacter sp.]|uniref:XrtA/PEP-CTERM system exopolysaccharide export protein n=1 Tax=Immundisolibacter sp. TaxID=1934948 RepID=UPI003562FB2D
MNVNYRLLRLAGACGLAAVSVMLGGCGFGGPPRAPATVEQPSDYFYIIGPGDSFQIMVWQNPEVSMGVTVRPDGMITTPLVEDLPAAGKTPTQLARDLEKALAEYIRDPIVTVIMGGFGGPYNQQIRVVGQAAQPRALQYREHMTVLDVLIDVGGLTSFAAGNRANIIRHVEGTQQVYRVRLDDLINGGDIGANVDVQPGDILVIPETMF